MFKTENFNIYEENLEDIVYGENGNGEKPHRKNDSTDKPIPKPPPRFWDHPLSYKQLKSESKETNNDL